MIGDEPFEPAIFVLHQLEPLRVTGLDIAAPLLPVGQNRLRDVVAADEVGGLGVGHVLLQDADDLLGRETALFTGPLGRLERRR